MSANTGPAPVPDRTRKTRRPGGGIGCSHFHQSIASEACLCFFRTKRIGGGDPSLGPHPSHSQKARKRSPDGLPRDPPLGKSLLKGSLCGHRKRPKATLVSELPRGAVEHLPKAKALLSSKASRVLSGREDLATRASSPLSLKSWMASGTVCCPQPKLWANLGAYSPLALARSIWHRRKVKVFFERREAWRASRSSSENERTKIGVFMALTITRNTKPILKMH